MLSQLSIKNPIKKSNSTFGFMLDLVIYLGVMFLIREVYFDSLPFIANGLFWSFTTLAVATWRMSARGITWRDLGLTMPKDKKQFAIALAFIPACAIGSIILFKMLSSGLGLELAADQSNHNAPSKFGDLYQNWGLFFIIMPFVLIQSALEELLDRAFLITWLEKLISHPLSATIFAVLAQAMIFGFRHSYDISERSITVALIGLAMGIAYVCFGRNLWALIIIHCIFNTASMVGRVTG